MTQSLAQTGGVELCFETFGATSDPAVLLIGGMAASMDYWDVGFCERVAGHGRFVIRYDHRDTGNSTHSPAGKPSYTSDDLATDPLRVLDWIGVSRAHLVGVSMGGGIAQELAARHPDRVLTITLIATSPAGTRTQRDALPEMAPSLLETFENPDREPDWRDHTAVVDYLVASERPYAGSLGFDEERARRVATAVVARGRDLAASSNHAIAPRGDAEPFRMTDIAAPTLVLHGTDDPLFPFGHGEALAREIPDAVLVPLDGMGHEVPPPPLWDVVVAAIVRHTTSRVS